MLNSTVTIVMYHYIREFSKTQYPRIKGLEFEGFQRQLDYLESNFEIIDATTLVAAIRGEAELPKNAALLTFDDGYKEHFNLAFSELSKRKLSGLFFPPVEPIRDRRLLDVNRVHFILAACNNFDELEQILDEYIAHYSQEYELPPVQDLKRDWKVANRFDSDQVIYVKRMLQTALPEPLREIIARALFSKYVTSDEADFANELYFDTEEARQMVEGGMYLGSHGMSHHWLNRIPVETQIKEVSSSLQFLKSIGSCVDDYWIMCYPYGGWNDALLDILTKHNCAAGLTTEVAVADISLHNKLLLPRFDTNDFPQ